MPALRWGPEVTPPRCPFCKLPPDACGCPVRGRRGRPQQTASGAYVWAYHANAADVHLLDIARGLANECRYGRQLRRRGQWYSVAEHTVILSHLVPERLRPLAMLHDAGEAYGFGDVPRPVRDDPECQAIVDRIEAPWCAAALERYNVTATADDWREIEKYEQALFVDEAIAILADGPGYLAVCGCADLPRLGVNIACLSPGAAEWVYLRRFAEVFPDRADEVERAMYPEDRL